MASGIPGAVAKSSTGGKYVQRGERTDVNFDDANLAGTRSSPGKVWQHEFVEGGGGGWFEGPEAGKAALPSAGAADAGLGGGGAGTGVDTSGLSAALGGLRSAAAPAPVAESMEMPLAAPGPGNPAIGQRIPPVGFPQLRALLAQQGRIY